MLRIMHFYFTVHMNIIETAVSYISVICPNVCLVFLIVIFHDNSLIFATRITYKVSKTGDGLNFF